MDDRHLRSRQATHRGFRDRLRGDTEFAIQHLGWSRRTVAAHADEFATVAKPARPITLDRGLDTDSGNSSKHFGPIFP